MHTLEVEAELKRLVDKHVRAVTLDIYDYLSRLSIGRAPSPDDDGDDGYNESPQQEGHNDDDIINEVAKEGIKEQPAEEQTVEEQYEAE